jgi:uncharacterized protein
MGVTLPIQIWRPGLPPGVYEERAARGGVAVARLDRAAFIGLAERGPLHTPVDVADWPGFQNVFGEAVPGLLMPEAVRLFFANGGSRCLVVRCLYHAVSHTRRLGLPGLEVLPALSDVERQPSLAARNPGAWASGLRLRLTLQRRPAPLRCLSSGATTLVASVGSLQVGDTLRLLAPRSKDADAYAAEPVLTRVAGLERHRAAEVLVSLQPAPSGELLDPELLVEARRLEVTLEIRLAGRLVERWPEATLHPEHPRFLPRLLGRRAASEELRPARAGGDSESPDEEADRLWGGPQEPWGSAFVRPSARLLDRSLRPTQELLERGEVWSAPLGDSDQEPWDRDWYELADPDGNQSIGREHFFAATDLDPAEVAADGDDRVLVFAGRPGPFDEGGALERWDQTHSLEPAALLCLPDLLHPLPETAPSLEPPVPAPSRCFREQADAPRLEPKPLQRHFPLLGYDPDDLLVAQRRLLQACEEREQGIALLDLPLRRVGDQLLPLCAGERATWLANLRSQRVAVYTPWLRTAAEGPNAEGQPITIGPAAVAAGLIARMEREQGVWRAPANLSAQAVFGAVDTVADELAGALHAERINAFRSTPAGLTLLGSRTTSADADWTHLSVRRLIDWLKLQIAAELAWAPFEPNGPALWDAMAGTARRRLRQVFNAGGLAGATEAESFFVRCDASTTSARERDAGRAVLLVGVAPSLPAEFLVFRLLRRGGEDPGLEVT